MLVVRVQFFSVTPLIETGVQDNSYNASVFNPALLGQLAWDFGYGFGFSYAFGAYSDIDQSLFGRANFLVFPCVSHGDYPALMHDAAGL
jgi:hypothetical protein